MLNERDDLEAADPPLAGAAHYPNSGGVDGAAIIHHKGLSRPLVDFRNIIFILREGGRF